MSNIIKFDGPYAETMRLLDEIQHYLINEERHDRLRVCERLAYIINIELMDIIARLSHVLSWLIAQKAVHAGEMSLEESLDQKLRLSSAVICNNTAYEADESLPIRLRRFMVESRKLFERVERLERQILAALQQ
jgi:regulator of CtrA degradation